MINFTDATNMGAMGGDAMGSIASFGILIVMFVIMYLILIRPQRKKDKELKEQQGR